MFWNNIPSNSDIDLALDQPDLTVKTLLDIDDILTELRGGNRKLNEFLIRSENLHTMIDLITTPPDADLDINVQYKHPTIACELLTSDVCFGEKIAADRSALEKLFNFLQHASANPLLASFVCRVIADIVARKRDQNLYSYQLNTIQLIGFLTENGADILQWILANIGTSAVRDLLSNLILNLEGQDMKSSLLDWLLKQNFVERLFMLMGGEDSSAHEAVHRLVVELLAAFREETSSRNTSSDTNILFDALRCPSTIKTLLNVILDADSSSYSSIKFGLQLLIALLGITEPPERPAQKSWIVINETMEHILIDADVTELLLTRFKDLGMLLKKEPCDELILTSGKVASRVGTMRLSVLSFFAHVASLRKAEFLDAMVELGILEDLLKIFWENTTNGFMHRAVEKIVTNILYTNEKNRAISYLFMEEKLLLKIPEKFRLPENNSMYLGILARISVAVSNVIVVGTQFEEYRAFCEAFKKGGEDWEAFVFEALEVYIAKQKTHLGGVVAPAPGSSLQGHEDMNPIDDWPEQDGPPGATTVEDMEFQEDPIVLERAHSEEQYALGFCDFVWCIRPIGPVLHWVNCELATGCGRWFHLRCLRLRKKTVEKMEHYYCAGCTFRRARDQENV